MDRRATPRRRLGEGEKPDIGAAVLIAVIQRDDGVYLEVLICPAERAPALVCSEDRKPVLDRQHARAPIGGGMAVVGRNTQTLDAPRQVVRNVPMLKRVHRCAPLQQVSPFGF
jgi:hypothetical protein